MNKTKILLFFIAVLTLTSCKANDTVTDIDGNCYKTVKIGTHVWMAENLKVTHYRNGEEIPNIKANADWGALSTAAWCTYENDATYGLTYGNLYNWYAVNDGRQLAPKGWHIPTDEEWTELTNYLGGDNVAGGNLKETGTAHWTAPNEGAVNQTIFNALPGGCRFLISGASLFVGNYGYWWSSTEFSPYNALSRNLSYGDGSVGRGYDPKSQGYSVRCVRDSE